MLGRGICSNMATCKIYNDLKSGVLAEYIRNYCVGDFQVCERYKLKATGQPVPPNLLPDGSVLPEEAKPEKPPMREGIRTII